jgi:DNA mismatch repair protein MutL
MLPEEVANKIAAGEVVERPASVVKELVENALDAGATRISVRLIAAGRRKIEVSDNGMGMSEQDALLAIERHTTSKIRAAADLDEILTFGFRGEALASIAAVSRFELVTRRAKDDAATRLRVEGGILRDVSEDAAPVGTRVTVNRLYFNTPVRAKFLKGVTTELSQCIDAVQRFTLASEGVGFQLVHNEKVLLDVPENATLRERAALIWGLGFVRELVELNAVDSGIRFHGLIGSPSLTRSSRTHQFFFLNGRPVVNYGLQYGFEDGYRQLLTIGRRPVGIVMVEAPPRTVDINIHPSKKEVRFRDERTIRRAIQNVVRQCLAAARPDDASRLAEASESDRVRGGEAAPGGSPLAQPPRPVVGPSAAWEQGGPSTPPPQTDAASHEPGPQSSAAETAEPLAAHPPLQGREVAADADSADPASGATEAASGQQTEFLGREPDVEGVEPRAVYRAVDEMQGAPMQLFDTYLLIPEEERLLIVDQHALHERLTYDHLRAELADQSYESQQMAVPILVDVPPSYVKLLQSNLDLLRRLGIEAEHFGGNTYQVTAACHLYDENQVSEVVCRVLDQCAQGDLFDREEILEDLLRLAVEACRGSVKAGDRLTPQERMALLDGFRRLRPPYTCPHGRPIVTELTLSQMEKSFRRKQ